MSKRRILVVDDVAENRDLLVRRLERSGYQVASASSGAACLEALASEPFDMVLLDVRMPGMSGLEALTQIRRDHKKTDLPVVMVTAETDSEQVVEALQLGANDYVTKPVDFPVALARIEMQLALRSEVASQKRTVVVTSTDGLESGFVIDGRFEIVELIGEGGFAVVYRARELSSGEQVAVKIMRSDRLANLRSAEAEIARFERELELIGRVSHPHIVQLVGSGSITRERQEQPEVDDTVVGVPPERAAAREREQARESAVPYLVMELLDGETLAAYRRRHHRLDATDAVDLIVPVAAAVATAHDAGVIHRDLKPSNIVLTEASHGFHPSVLDFGIGKLVGDGIDDLTRTASVIGTPDYMSPEQARGKRDITGAADQYTLAVVLYECITGHKPYDAESFVELVHLVSAGNFEPPSSHCDDIDSQLESVIVRAMALTPQERFPSMTAFGRALLAFASDAGRRRYAPLFG